MKKIDTLLIDDEVLALEFIENLINWEKEGFHIVGSATNGEEGLELFKQYRPQLVITDICMPGKNGLDLCQELRNLVPEVKLVILTAYKRFDYAQRAIGVGVVDYIVKHEITAETLEEKMRSVYQKLEEDYQGSRMAKRELLKSVMMGNQKDPKAFWELSKELDHEKRQFVLFFYRKKHAGPLVLCKKEETKSLEDLEYMMDLDVNESIYVSLWSIASSCLKLRPKQLESQAEAVYEWGAEAPLEETTCIVNCQPQQIRFMEKLYTMCLQYQEYARLMEISKRVIVLGERETQILNRKSSCPGNWDTIYRMRSNLQKGEVYTAVELLKKLYLQDLMESGTIKDAYLCNQMVVNILCKEQGGVDPLVEEELLQRQLEQCQSLREMYGLFSEKMLSLQVKNDCGAKIQSDKIREAVKYMNRNYMKNIGIGDIAQYLGVSESYLVKSFKKEMKETVLDYLTGVRIRVAKERLLDSKSRIYKVAEECGFRSSQYFSNVFLRKTGMTPKQYKQVYEEKEEA